MTPGVAVATGFLFALANAAHCAAMCGGFALRAAAPPWRLGIVVYGAGKAFTYGFLGALAGTVGSGVLAAGEAAQVVLGIAVACVLVAAAVVRLRGPKPRSAGGGPLAAFLQPLLAQAGRAESVGGRFALGALTAALPCGVVYFAALQAAASGTRAAAFLLMLGFAAGTMPALALVAFLGAGIRSRCSPRVIRLASAAVMMVLGLFALYRASLPLLAGDQGPPCCH